MATPPAPPKSNTRRDALLKLEAQVQQQWESEGTFEADAQQGKPKFFVTFPHATVSHHKKYLLFGYILTTKGNFLWDTVYITLFVCCYLMNYVCSVFYSD